MKSFDKKLVKETIGVNDPRYTSLMNKFCDDVCVAFTYIDREMLKQRFDRYIKNIYIGGPAGFSNGVYIPFRKALAIKDFENTELFNHTFTHEVLHAMAREKNTFARNGLKLKNYFKKIYEMDEGITEYLSYVIGIRNGVDNKGITSTGSYPGRTVVIHKLAQIFGEEQVVNSYFGINQELISSINKSGHNIFNKLLKGTSLIASYSASRRHFVMQKGNINLNQILDDLFNKEKIVPVRNIDDFKSNTIARATYEMDVILDTYNFINQAKNEHNEVLEKERVGYAEEDMKFIVDKIKEDWVALPNHEDYNMAGTLNECLKKLDFSNQFKILFNAVTPMDEKEENSEIKQIIPVFNSNNYINDNELDNSIGRKM